MEMNFKTPKILKNPAEQSKLISFLFCCIFLSLTSNFLV